MEGAEPFIMTGGRKGVLLVHGFTGSPDEMRLLGGYLRERGYTVLAPRLAGHGLDPREMAQTNSDNWFHSVWDGYYLLRCMCDDIAIVGLSMGALLSLNMSRLFPLKCAAALSAPIYVADSRVKYLPSRIESAGKFVRKKRRKFSALGERYSASYAEMPLLNIHHLLELINRTKEHLAKVDIPLLVIQSLSDHTVRPDSARYIYDHVSSADKELVWLENSGHIVTLDSEREIVFAQIAAFLQRYL